jgi:hypothetical protein
MRWPWRRRRRNEESERADEAIAASEEARERVGRQWQDVRRVERSHRALREHNHFAEAFRRALKDGN